MKLWLPLVISSLALAACERHVEIDATQFEELENMCKKNGGLLVVEYETSMFEQVRGSFEYSRRGNERPTLVHCKDGAFFEIPEEMF